jgi:hypothetical protein
MGIWQDLVDRSGFTGANESVKRYAGQLFAPVAQKYWRMDSLGIDTENRPAPADLASQTFSPEARRTLQVRFGDC